MLMCCAPSHAERTYPIAADRFIRASSRGVNDRKISRQPLSQLRAVPVNTADMKMRLSRMDIFAIWLGFGKFVIYAKQNRAYVMD